jgi:hypothetical protein
MTAEWRLHQSLTAWHAGYTALLADDPEADLGAMDAEDLENALRQAVTASLAASAMAKAARERATELGERARRFDARAARYRGLMLAVFDTMGWRKKEWPEATVSMRQPQPGVQILNEAELPEAFVRIERSPNKEAIRTALKDGEVVSSAVLTNGAVSLMIRGS